MILHGHLLSIRKRQLLPAPDRPDRTIRARFEEGRIPVASHPASVRPCASDGATACCNSDVIGLRLLQRGGHRGEWRLELMRDRIEKRLLQFLRLRGDLRCRLCCNARSLFKKSASCAAKASSNSRCSIVGGACSRTASTPQRDRRPPAECATHSASGSVSVDFPAACLFETPTIATLSSFARWRERAGQDVAPGHFHPATRRPHPPERNP